VPYTILAINHFGLNQAKARKINELFSGGEKNLSTSLD